MHTQKKSLLTSLLLSLAATTALAQTAPSTTPARPARAGGGGGEGFGMGPTVTPEIVAKAAAAPIPAADGPFQPTWDSIRQNYKIPQWFLDAKFGITMHWGLYSVPAYHNEWYEKHMYAAFVDWHAQHFGPQDKFGYKDFIPMFTAKNFNADAWAELVKKSGAKYLMPTCEHHDGFSMWDSQINPYNAAKMGPKRDIIGELAVAARKLDLKFGVCNHNIEHYTFIQPKAGLKSDLDDPAFADFYWTHHDDATLQKFLENWVAKNVEIIDKYQPDIIWFDNGVNSRAYDPLKTKVAAYYYNRAKQWGKDVTIDTKSSAYLAGSVLDFEKIARETSKGIIPGIWETEDTAGSTWGYTSDETFRSAQSIISQLCNTVARNGNFLLNLSPMADGTIPEPEQKALLETGKWLATNGEAIYGTHNWTTWSEGPTPARNAPDTRTFFTVNDQTLYALPQSWPGDSLTLTSLATGKAQGAINSITLLGSPDELQCTQDNEGLKIKLPPAPTPNTKYPIALKITGLSLPPPPLPTPSDPHYRGQ